MSLKGITGAAHLDPVGVKAKVTELQARTALPVLVGFGIKDAESARAIGESADGVVVGSALVRTMGDSAIGDIDTKLTAQVAQLRDALDSLN